MASSGMRRTLAWPWQLPERGFQTELKEFAHAQRYRMAIHAIAASHRPVFHAAGRIQKYRRM